MPIPPGLRNGAEIPSGAAIAEANANELAACACQATRQHLPDARALSVHDQGLGGAVRRPRSAGTGSLSVDERELRAALLGARA